MRPTINLVLTHDWELRGNGSGDIERIQFAPMRKLLKIYNKFGVRVSYTPDLMQQLAFRKLEGQHPELRSLADSWDEHLREAFRQGHDIQLHTHPQWLGAEYEGGEWCLTSGWSILNYDPETAFAMLAESKSYLENLLQPLDPSYRCIAFRAGALAVAPSSHLLGLLVQLGIVVDVSLAGGLHVNTSNLQLDYRNCEETFLPFYPRMEDARKVSPQAEKIVCVPIHHFYGSRREAFKQQVSFVWGRVRQRIGSSAAKKDSDDYAQMEWSRKGHFSSFVVAYEKGIAPYLRGRHLVSDTARLNSPLLREMLTSIRQRALASGEEEVPVVLTNHPKEIRSFTALENLIAEASEADDIRFITLTDLARKLLAREFPIRRMEAGVYSDGRPR
jgi:hypothetical protein